MTLILQQHCHIILNFLWFHPGRSFLPRFFSLISWTKCWTVHCYTSVWLFLPIIIHFIMWSMFHKGEVSEVNFGNSLWPIRYEGGGGGVLHLPILYNVYKFKKSIIILNVIYQTAMNQNKSSKFTVIHRT